MRLRDRLLGQPRFHRFAARFALTRPIARREARALFDVCAGFVYAQVLSACVELDLFERVAARPVPVPLLATECVVPEPALRMLVRAASSLRLLKLRRDSVRLAGLGAALRGNPGLAEMVRHHRLFYQDIADPVALLRGQVDTRLGKFWPYAAAAGESAAYSTLMAATQPMIAAQVLDAYDVSRHACVLDAGGGDGSFLRQLATRAPNARLILFDLPAVAAAAARQAFEQAGLAARTQVVEGDFTTAAWPQGADLITLVRVLHDHGDESVLRILRAAHAALPPRGTLLVAEPMGSAAGTPAVDAYFGFYLLAMGSGRPRRADEIETLLRQAGFTQTRRHRTNLPMLVSVITATSA